MGRFSVMRNILILAGYLNGIWIAIGFNPQDELFGRLGDYVVELDPRLSIVFKAAPIIMISTAILTMYIKGKRIGLFSLLIGFVAGLLILHSWITSVIFLILGIIVAWLAARQ